MFKLKEDFYAASFISMKKDIAKEFGITSRIKGRNFYALLVIYLIELTLIALILKSICFDVENFTIVTPNIDVYVTRFLTCLLMHMSLIEDV